MDKNKKTLLFSFIDIEISDNLKRILNSNEFDFKLAAAAEIKPQLSYCDLVITDDPSVVKLISETNPVMEKPPLLAIIKEQESSGLQLDQEKLGEDFIRYPSPANEIELKIRSLLRKNDIYRMFGRKSDIGVNQSIAANRILLIDDDPKLAKLFDYNLSKAGFIVKVAYSGNYAALLVKEFKPDIIVCDIMMPGMDGYDFRKFLLADPELKEIPFVFLTAKEDEQDILDGYGLEIEDYILKTVGPKVLVARLTAILKSLEKERKKMVTEIHQAADGLRAKVVPDSFPDFECFRIKHWHEPYKGVPGGDFIDYFNIDKDNLAIILGDVMGKKWGAWYFAFAYVGYIRSAIRVVLQTANELSPAVLLQKINESIYQDAKISEVFATLSIVVLNKKDKIALYAGAGDLPLIHCNTNSKSIQQITAEGLLLGFSADGKYSNYRIPLIEHDRIVLLTDGIIESRNSDGIQFGLERLKDIILNSPANISLLETIKKSISDYTNNNFDDDISLITVQCGG